MRRKPGKPEENGTDRSASLLKIVHGDYSDCKRFLLLFYFILFIYFEWVENGSRRTESVSNLALAHFLVQGQCSKCHPCIIFKCVTLIYKGPANFLSCPSLIGNSLEN